MKPVSNAYALEALFPDMALNEWRTIAVEYDQMLDLSEATHFYYYINSYGGSGGSGYETRLRLYSENDVWEQTVSMMLTCGIVSRQISAIGVGADT